MARLRPLALLPLLVLVAPAVRAEDAEAARLAQAREEAPGEVQLHVARTTGRLSDFVAKVRTVERVPGWSQVRARGEAAFAAWDQHKRDFVWRTEAFEVLWDIDDRGRLKLNAVTLGGISRKADP